MTVSKSSRITGVSKIVRNNRDFKIDGK